MSYRTIVLDKKQYEYSIGKTHVKVKGVGCWPKEEVGHKETRILRCECCGEPLSMLYPSTRVDPVVLVVSPKDIASVIRAHARRE